MRQMAEREEQLDSLTGKTMELQGASAAFGSSAKRLQQSYTWQKYRVYLVVMLIALWIACAIIKPQWLPYVIGVSLTCIAGGYIAGYCFRGSSDDDDSVWIFPEIESGNKWKPVPLS